MSLLSALFLYVAFRSFVRSDFISLYIPFGSYVFISPVRYFFVSFFLYFAMSFFRYLFRSFVRPFFFRSSLR